LVSLSFKGEGEELVLEELRAPLRLPLPFILQRYRS